MKTRFEILSLAALPAVARRLEDGRPMLVFAEDGRTLLAANAGGFARVGATTAEARRAAVGATVAGLDARLADRVARFAASAEVGATAAELLRYFQGFKPVLVQIALEKTASPEAGVAVLLTFEAAGTRPAEAGDIGAALDGFTGADGLVAAFDAEGDVLAASGDHGVLDDAHEEIEAIVEAADHLPLHAATVEKAGTVRDVAVVTVPGEGRVRRLLYVGGVRPVPATSAGTDAIADGPAAPAASAEGDAVQAEAHPLEAAPAEAAEAHSTSAVSAPETPLPVFDRDHLMSEASTDAADAVSAADADGEAGPVEFLAEALPVDHPVVAVEPPSAVLLAGLETATPSQPYPAMSEAELGEAIGFATGRTPTEAPAETASDIAPAPAAADAGAAPSGFRFRASDRTIKFAWQMDAERRFTFVSDLLASAVGPRAADIVGRSWSEVATAYGLDPDGGIARSLDRRDTWSGRTALWPVEGEALRVPVDLAALPAFGRSRNFEGYRGFGTIRANETVPDPTGLGLILAGAAKAAEEHPEPPVPSDARTPAPEKVEPAASTGGVETGALGTTAGEAMALGALATVGAIGLAHGVSSGTGHDAAREHAAPEMPAGEGDTVEHPAGAVEPTATDADRTEAEIPAAATEPAATAEAHETAAAVDEDVPSAAVTSAEPEAAEAPSATSDVAEPVDAAQEAPAHAEADAPAGDLAVAPEHATTEHSDAVEAVEPVPPAAETGPAAPEPVVAPPRRGAIEVTMAAAFGFSSMRTHSAAPTVRAAEPQRDAPDDVVPSSEVPAREEGTAEHAARVETLHAVSSDLAHAVPSGVVDAAAAEAPAGEVETTAEAEPESEGTTEANAAGPHEVRDAAEPADRPTAAETVTGHHEADASAAGQPAPSSMASAADHAGEIAAAEAGLAEIAASEKPASDATVSDVPSPESSAPAQDAHASAPQAGPAETSTAPAAAVGPAATTRVTTLPSKTGSKIVTLASATRLLPEANRLSGPERVAFRQIAEALGARIEGDEPAARAEVKPATGEAAHPVPAEPSAVAEAALPAAHDGRPVDEAGAADVAPVALSPVASVSGETTDQAEPAISSSEVAPSLAEAAHSHAPAAEALDAGAHGAGADGMRTHEVRPADPEPRADAPAEEMPTSLAPLLDAAPAGSTGAAEAAPVGETFAAVAEPLVPTDAGHASVIPAHEPADVPASVETIVAPASLVANAEPARPQDAQPSDHSRPQDARLLDRLPLAAAIIHDERIDYANDAFLKLLGYADLAELVGAGGLDTMFAGPHAARRAAGEGTQPIPVLAKDGSVVPVDAYLATVPWNGGTGLMLTLDRLDDRAAAPVEPMIGAVDTGGRAQQETGGRALHEALDRVAELEAIVDTATDGVIMLAGDGTVLACNRAAEALFGMDRKEMVGKGLSGLLAPESRRSAMDYLDGLARNGVASVLNDGREVIGQVAPEGLIPLFMTIGRISAGDSAKFCAVLRDITQWKKSEEDLTAERKRAEEASVHKSDFLAKISHEIRTPLNAIIGFSEVMIDERFGAIGNDRYKDYLRDIHTSGTHIMSLINDLLDLSKVEAGKMDLRFEAVGLGELLAECVAIMQPQANRERIIIRTSLPASVPPVVADPRSVRQIVLNLLSNAVKFTPAGGQVIVSTSFEDTGEVVMRVRDTGYGMTEKEIETALEPFRQLHTARAKGAGTGLGLPLTKALTEANRASFKIDSAVNQGTLVTITFPVTRVLAN